MKVKLGVRSLRQFTAGAAAPPSIDPTKRVLLANTLIKLKDLNPILRNDNNTTHAQEISCGGSAAAPFMVAGVPNMLTEAFRNTGFPANNGQTGPMHATAPTTFQGPWTLSPATALVITPGDTTTWEYNEFSPSDIKYDSSNARLQMTCHGGNNNGPRQVGYAYSTDGAAGLAWTKDASNPLLLVGTSGAFDDKTIADLKWAKNPVTGLWVGLYRAIKTGSALTDGTVGRVTGGFGVVPGTPVKTGQVISAAPSWNTTGIATSTPWYDVGCRLHMFPPGGFVGVGYYYSDNDGVTWTAGNSGNRVGSPSGTAGAYDKTSFAGEVQLVQDGDVLFMTINVENITDYPTNLPLRGLAAAITPARVVTPTKKGKFYVANARTDITATSSLAQTVFGVMGRFRAYRVDRTLYRTIYFEEPTGGGSVGNKQLFMQIDGGANAGKIQFFYRTPTAFVQLFSTSVVDDAVWHTFLFRRISTNSFEAYVDGVLCATSANNPTTDATATLKCVGNMNPAMTESDGPLNGTVSDLGVVYGYAPTAAEATAWISSRTALGGGTVVVNFPTDGTDSGDVALVEGT